MRHDGPCITCFGNRQGIDRLGEENERFPRQDLTRRASEEPARAIPGKSRQFRVSPAPHGDGREQQIVRADVLQNVEMIGHGSDRN
jgi:hypothetical protein